MHETKRLHPVVSFTYFIFVIGFSMFFMHPVCLTISLICAFIYSLMLNGKKAIKTNLLYMLPMLFIATLMNPLFNHEGVTIIRYLPDGNPVTLESVIYGFLAAIMIISVICWFSCFNVVMTSDKITYIFGKSLPSLSLLFSMTLRLVPRFSARSKTVINAQKCIGKDISNGGILTRIKNGLSVFFVMMAWMLESSIEISDSMKARGYGIKDRTSFSMFKFKCRDVIILCIILFLSSFIISGYFFGAIDFRFFPDINVKGLSAFGISIFFAYFMLCALPVIIEIKEWIKWKLLRQKI